MNWKLVKLFFVWMLALLVIAIPLHAQVSGATLSGTVTDAQGGVVADAKISAKNVATGLSTDTTTNSSGVYSNPNLNPGDYEITVSAPGFRTIVTRLTLTVGAKQELNLSLTVGQVQQEIEVTGVTPQVELQTSTIAGDVMGSQIVDLPLNGRDWASLATLQPGVVSVRTQELVTQIGSHARGLGLQLSIGGNRPTQNTYRLNGLIINDYSNAGPGSVLGQNLGVDAIQEFSVLTSNYSGEYGFTSGGVINAVTKAGTNQLHGSVYEFVRNDVFDAANYFDSATGSGKPHFSRNQFGAAAGGPIKKDKIFIFGDYEGLRQSKGLTSIAKVPSPNARLGILNDASGNPLPALVGPCPNLNSTNLSPGQAAVCVDNQIEKFLTFYNLPNAGLIGPDNNTGRFAFSGAQRVPENYGTSRVDIKPSEKNAFVLSYYYDHSIFSRPDATNNISAGFEVGRQGASVEESHIFSSSLVNTVRAGWNKTYGFGQTTFSAINPAAADPSFGVSPGFFAPRISVSQLTLFQGGMNGESVQDYTNQSYQAYDDAAHTAGKHNLKFGVMFLRIREGLFAPFTEDGNANYDDLQHFLANDAHAVAGAVNLAQIKNHVLFTSVPAVYIQDDWKARPNLTLNLGLRYEMNTVPTESHGLVQNLPFPWTNPAVGPFNKVFFTKNPTTKNFEPRLGFAWDPFQNGKTAIRGGFGIFDALPLPYELAIDNAQSAPFHTNAGVTGCSFTTPPNTQPCAAIGAFPHNIGAPLAAAGVTPANQTWDYPEPTPSRNYIYQYNLNIQRQITPNTSVTLAYAGSRGLHNPFQLDDYNTVFPTLTSAGWLFPGNPVCSAAPPPACGQVPPARNPTGISPGLLINPNINGPSGALLLTTLWHSKSWYNALEVNVEKRMSHGLQLQGAFTWSKTMDTSSGSFAGDNFAGDVSPTVPWWDLRIVKGLSDFNVGRNLVINALWQIPTPQDFLGSAGWILRGWQLSGIVELSDGVPVWPLSITPDPMGQLNSEPIAIPNRVPGCALTNPSSGRHGTLQYVNPNCFINAVAPAGFDPTHTKCDQAFIQNYDATNPTPLNPNTCINLLGNLGRNTVISPGLINFDFSMLKDTHIARISEGFDIQFRADIFNAFNRANFNPPADNLTPFDNTGARVPGFGQLDTAQPAREIQFSLKVIW
jgi:hypothetical protein